MNNPISKAASSARALARRLPVGVDLASTLAPALERAVARGIAALPRSVVTGLAGPPVEIDGQRLDPFAQLGLRLDRLSRRPAFETLSPRGARAAFARLVAAFEPSRPIPMAVVSERTISSPDGGRVRLRRYLPGPRGGDPSPVLIYFHGGGHVIGDLDTHDGLCRLLAHRSGIQIVSVDYRRAPEHPFPAAFDDALAAFRWVRDADPDEGFDPARVAVGGDSAGSNLAAAVAIATARAGEPGPAFQLLFYPMLDATSADPSAPSRPRSYALFGEGFGLDATTIAWFRSLYLAGADPTDVRVSPLRAPDLSGVAPAWVGAAGFDPLRDEAADFAARLRGAGVPVDHRAFPELMHGFAIFFGVIPAARAGVEEAAAALVAGLRPAQA